MGSFSSSDDGMTTANRLAPSEETELYCPACDESFSEGMVHCPQDGTRLVRLSEVRDPLLGRNIEGRFLIRERLGTGGMGAVYRAWQGSVGREVAVKVIEARLGGGRLAAKRFLREAKLASRLSHPSTVSVIDFGQTEDGLLYLVMELVKGRTLGEVLLEDGPFSLDRMIRVGLQLCDALEAAHKLSIIHRDLKPSNIIVLDDPPGRDLVKVLDFGLAKSLVDEGSTTMTQSDAIMGTPSYIPPEAVTQMHFDERSDLYSLGVILYEVLAGRLPFHAATVQEMLRQHAYEKPLPLPPQVPPQLSNLMYRLLAKEPDARPQTAALVRDGLLNCAGLGSHSTPLPQSAPIAIRYRPATPVGFDAATPYPAAHLESVPTLRRRRRGWLWLGVLVVAAAAAALALNANGLLGARNSAPHPAAAGSATPGASEGPSAPAPGATGSTEGAQPGASAAPAAAPTAVAPAGAPSTQGDSTAPGAIPTEGAAAATDAGATKSAGGSGTDAAQSAGKSSPSPSPGSASAHASAHSSTPHRPHHPSHVRHHGHTAHRPPPEQKSDQKSSRPPPVWK